MMDLEEKEMERFLLEMVHTENIPLSDEMQSILKEMQTSIPFPTGVDTTMEAAPAPPPPPIVPAQPMLSSYSQTVENLNAVYMEAAPAPPPQLMAAPAVYNQRAPAVYNQGAPAVYNQGAPAVYNQGAPAVYSQVAPAVYGQAAPAYYGQGAPAVYGQGAPAVYGHCATAVYGQCAPAVYAQAAPAFYGQAAPVFQYGQNTMQTSGYLYNQPFAQSQGQYLPPQQQVYLPGAPVSCAPQQQFMQMLIPNQDFTLPVGVLNGEVVYGMATGPSHASAPANNITAKPQQPKVKQPYVKRPPNAFMLYLKDQRPYVMAEVKLLTNDTINSATVNSILGQRWKNMTKEQQGKYFLEAAREREIHNMQHPGWSPGQNYGKKKKRVRTKASKNTEESALEATDFTGIVDNQSELPKQIELMGPPISKVPEVTIPHFFSLHSLLSNSAPPKHQLHSSTRSNDPECPMQQ
nr:PREDICTED: extensin-1-like [Paralichthys olivaceus]XP_019942131.1 PREDICTED: extensin-1-like [Paralichthys olivaceus]XP_019942132.1 PREDICTED: extensin-1-like [Paralichthys olivaceus]